MADPNELPEHEPVPSTRMELFLSIVRLASTVVRIIIKTFLVLIAFAVAFIGAMAWRR